MSPRRPRKLLLPARKEKGEKKERRKGRLTVANAPFPPLSAGLLATGRFPFEGKGRGGREERRRDSGMFTPCIHISPSFNLTVLTRHGGGQKEKKKEKASTTSAYFYSVLLAGLRAIMGGNGRGGKEKESLLQLTPYGRNDGEKKKKKKRRRGGDRS